MPLVITVSRFVYKKDRTLGTLWIGGKHIGYTLENDEEGNKKNVSCIPTGEYPTEIRKKYQSANYNYDHLILRDVPERTFILFHVGNKPRHTEGCILPGKGVIPSMVTNSLQCFNELMEAAKQADSITTMVEDCKI